METSASLSWREQFLTLIAGVRRHFELPAACNGAAPGAPLLAGFVIDGVRIELLHMAHGPASGARFLMQGRFGPLPPDAPADMLAAILARNQELARLQLGHYGLEEADSELVFNLLQPMADLDATQLAMAMTDISAIARQWRAYISDAHQ